MSRENGQKGANGKGGAGGTGGKHGRDYKNYFRISQSTGKSSWDNAYGDHVDAGKASDGCRSTRVTGSASSPIDYTRDFNTMLSENKAIFSNMINDRSKSISIMVDLEKVKSFNQYFVMKSTPK